MTQQIIILRTLLPTLSSFQWLVQWSAGGATNSKYFEFFDEAVDFAQKELKVT